MELCDESGCNVEFYGDNYGFTVRFYRHCGEGWANYKNPSMTVSEISNTLKLSEGGVRYHINILRKEGVLRHEGSTKSGKWTITGA